MKYYLLAILATLSLNADQGRIYFHDDATGQTKSSPVEVLPPHSDMPSPITMPVMLVIDNQFYEVAFIRRLDILSMIKYQ